MAAAACALDTQSFLNQSDCAMKCQFALAWIAIALGGTCLVWRTLELVASHSHHPVPWLFFALEAILYLSSLLWLLDTLHVLDRSRRPTVLPPPLFQSWPTVDILIPCCGEPTSLVRDTVLAALWQDYPASQIHVFVCDDGCDEALRVWVEHEMGIARLRYTRRVKVPSAPHHAKAGNINHALRLTSSAFVVILDADMLIRPDFLCRTLAQFDTPKVAFVQVPQSYYNVPQGDPLGQVASFFYLRIMPCRDTRGSAPSVGTGVVFRRTALEATGGIATGTLTEDFDTSLRLHANGWISAYVSERLQWGLVPTDLGAALRQRERWAIGTLQILAKRNPLFAPGLSWHQRVMYLSCGIAYLLPIVILAFITLPLLALFFNWPILPTRPEHQPLLLFLLVPYLVATRLLMYTMYSSLQDPMTARNRDLQLFLWMAPFQCVAIYKWIRSAVRPARFKVTNASTTDAATAKEDQTSPRSAKQIAQCQPWTCSLWMCWFHVLYIVVAIVGLALQAQRIGRSCSTLLTFSAQMLFVLLNVQAMAAPIVYALTHREQGDPEVARRARLSYNANGVPQIDERAMHYRSSRWVWLLELVPAVWALFYVVRVLLFVSSLHPLN
ncbi:glycosyltransferase like family 2-domain-containing protein [Blastocladiella britannica]|nr:glycosyltransferase like family 2-domain-containing protein [Blastocladiella britannica]